MVGLWKEPTARPTRRLFTAAVKTSRIFFEAGHKVCQIVIDKQVDGDWQVIPTNELSETAWSTAGFNSSGG